MIRKDEGKELKGLTSSLDFVGDDATNEMWVSGIESSHQFVQLFSVTRRDGLLWAWFALFACTSCFLRIQIGRLIILFSQIKYKSLNKVTFFNTNILEEIRKQLIGLAGLEQGSHCHVDGILVLL